MLARWYYFMPYIALVTLSTVFYFIAGTVDPGFVSSESNKAIIVAYEVNLYIIYFVIFKTLRVTVKGIKFFSSRQPYYRVL